VANTVDMIGLQADELPWVRLLIGLLRHPEPLIPQLAHEALLYCQQAAGRTGLPKPSSTVPRAI